MFHFKKIPLRGMWLVAFLMVLYVVNFVHRQLPAVLAPQLQPFFGWSNLEAGFMYGTVFALFYALAGLAISLLPGVRSLHRLIPAAVLFWSAAVIAQGFATSWPAFAAGRIALALAQSAVTPMIYAMLARHIAEDRLSTAFSVYAGGIFLGIGASYAGAGAFAAVWSWQTVFHWCGAVGFLLGMIAFAVLPETRVPAARAFSVQPVVELFKQRPVRLHLAGFSFLSFTGYSVLAFAAPYVQTEAGGVKNLVWFGLFAAGCSVSVFAAGRLADRAASRWFGRAFWVPAGMAAAGWVLYTMGFAAFSDTGALLAFGFGMLVTSSYNGLAPALLQRIVTPALHVPAGAVYLLVINLAGLGLGPLITGFLADETGSLRFALALSVSIGNLGSISFLVAASRAATIPEAAR